MPFATPRRWAAIALLAIVRPLGAQADSTRSLPPDTTEARALQRVRVTARPNDVRGIARTASEGRVAGAELQRPLMREGELLETVPGLVVTQHSGDGKANQYFLRGFNLDHGTDFQTRLEGMPVNMPSHAHGQGYTDLSFIIPEFVDHIDYRVGVSHAEVGDFGSAGSAEFHLARKLDRSFISTAAGAHGFARLVTGASTRMAGGDLLVGGEIRNYDGPWALDERLRKSSGLARYSRERGATRVSVLGLAYRNRWNATDQIPLRGVASGKIGRFGHVDGSAGGRTQRYSVSGTWQHVGSTAVREVQLFGIYSDLDLYSNFTYFLDDPNDGDQFNQREQRVVLGGSAKETRSIRGMGADHELTMGLQGRGDVLFPVGLHRARDRVRTSRVREDDVRQLASGLFVEAHSRWAPWLRTALGARGDAYLSDVQSDRPENSGHRGAGIVSPKAAIVLAPTSHVELYLSGGMGFHSNDARGSTTTVDPASGERAQPVDPLVRSRGGEIGIRASPLYGLESTLAVWTLVLDSELLFVGDAGTTAPANGSRRSGATWSGRYRPLDWITLSSDVSMARARLTDVPYGEDRVPGALERVVSGGVAWGTGAGGLAGAIRVKSFGSYPLIEDNSVRAAGTTTVNASLGVPVSGLRLEFTMLNLLNHRGSDIQYFYASRLPGEPASGVEDIHFHPVEPRQLRVSLSRGR